MFTHLHVHTEFSMLDGLSRVTDLCEQVAKDGGTHVAVTDHGTLGGMWQAQKAADAHGITLIPGVEAYLAIGDRMSRDTITVTESDTAAEGADTGTKQRAYEHITLLAVTQTGWENLVRIQNESSKHQYYRAKLVDFSLLEQYSDGIVALTGCVGGPVFGPVARAVQAYYAGNTDRISEEMGRAKHNLERLITIYGHDRVFVEVMEHGNEFEQDALTQLVKLAKHYGVKTVATNDSHHTHERDSQTHAAWLAVQSKSTIYNPKFSFHGDGYHVRSEKEMRNLRSEDWWQEACDNTMCVAGMVTGRILPPARPRLPEFPLPDGFSSSRQYLKSLLLAGLEKHYPDGFDETVRQRVNHELDTIYRMGFVDYFLIVSEMVEWAKNNNILVGPGRGSAAGSMVAFLLGITSVNPLEYGLLFERFLEPGRAGFPDIDVDFESRKREEVLEHLRSLWGENNVAQIGAVARPKIRAALKHALRVLGESASFSDRLAKLLPQDFDGRVLAESKHHPALADFWRQFASYRHKDQVLKLVAGFYDIPSNHSVHASGVLISPEPLDGLIPLTWTIPGDSDTPRWVTEWDHRDLEDFGLVKFDVLAVRNLDMASTTFTQVGMSVDDIPSPESVDDRRVRETFTMLQHGRTAGVFQLESDSMTQLLSDVAPETITELSAVVALFRPGPLSANMHTRYVARKHGNEAVSYEWATTDDREAAWLDRVLGETFGVFIYQEQLMELGRVVAGFDDVWRSKLRKAVSKKNEQMMQEVGEKFLSGATQLLCTAGCDQAMSEKKHRRVCDGEIISPVFAQQTARQLWDAMKGSAEYLFNKSHSMCYAYIAFWTAYLKSQFTSQYGAAILNVTGSSQKLKRVAAIQALQGEGVEVCAPDINLSQYDTVAETDSRVRLGLGEIAGVSQVEQVLHAREDGPFRSFYDFRIRTADTFGKQLPPRIVDALIDSGALDCFGARAGLRMIAGLSTPMAIDIPQVEYGPVERGVRQMQRLFTILDKNVLSSLSEMLEDWSHPSNHAVHALSVGDLLHGESFDGQYVYVSGVCDAWNERAYSKGRLGQLLLRDGDAVVSGVVWDSERQAMAADGVIPQPGFPLVVYGKISQRSFTVSDGDGGEEVVSRKEITIREVFPVAPDMGLVGDLDCLDGFDQFVSCTKNSL